MPNLLSVHWIPTHGRESDLQYMMAIAPAVIKTVDADPHRVRQAYEKCGAAPLYLLRDWALSEQKNDMRNNPVQTGVRHAKERIAAARNYNIPQNRIVLCGINEPEVWTDKTCVPYTVAFLDELHRQGYTGAALNLSVGWPANDGADTPPNWKPYEPVLGAIQRGSHYLCLHEYWDHHGPDYNWGWWAGRYEKCPWQVPIIIGECGIDEYVSNPNIEPDKRGWHGQVSASEYQIQMRTYIARCGRDKRIVGCCVYTTDYSHPWSSFDTEPASRELAAIYMESGAGPTPPEPGPDPEPIPPDATLVHPVAGATLTQHFYQNPQNYAQFNLPGHNGLDLGISQGTPIKCMADGVVAWSDVDQNYGEYVRVNHGQYKAYTFYAHLSRRDVTAGQQVKAGAILGLVGSTGNSTGPHLHLEVRLHNGDGTYKVGTPMIKGRVDPETWAIMHGLNL